MSDEFTLVYIFVACLVSYFIGAYMERREHKTKVTEGSP